MTLLKNRKKSFSWIITTSLICLLLSESARAQTKLPTNENGAIQFNGIVNIDSAQAQDLYGKALKWIGITFKTPGEAIKMKIPDTHTIIANGITDLDWPYVKGRLGFTINIECKDNKYRYTIDNLLFYDRQYREYPTMINEAASVTSKAAERARKNLLTSVNGVVASLYEAMVKKDNW